MAFVLKRTVTRIVDAISKMETFEYSRLLLIRSKNYAIFLRILWVLRDEIFGLTTLPEASITQCYIRLHRCADHGLSQFNI